MVREPTRLAPGPVTVAVAVWHVVVTALMDPDDKRIGIR